MAEHSSIPKLTWQQEKKRSVYLVERLEKMIPSVPSECPLVQDVSELASGVHIFDLDFRGPD